MITSPAEYARLTREILDLTAAEDSDRLVPELLTLADRSTTTGAGRAARPSRR